MENQLPDRKFNIGDVVRIIDHDIDGQNGIHVVTGAKLTLFSYFRTHSWEYLINDRFSSSGWFDEEKLEATTPKNDDERDYITGGNVPFRNLAECQNCKKMRIDDGYDCPYCSYDPLEGETNRNEKHMASDEAREEAMLSESPSLMSDVLGPITDPNIPGF